MLSHPLPAAPLPVGRLPAGQGGVVLLIALIILVAMTIGGIALFRSVSTTSLITGNLAFQQAATRSGEAGTETAIRSVEVGNASAMSTTDLYNDNFARGYAASTPAAGNPANWDTYWSATINPNPAAMPVLDAACTEPAARRPACICADRSCTLITDAAGNTATYTIQRLCQTAGDPLLLPTGCASAPPNESALSGNCLTANCMPPPQIQKYYYRITTRIAGPRNTVSYIQAIVSR